MSMKKYLKEKKVLISRIQGDTSETESGITGAATVNWSNVIVRSYITF